MRTRGRGPTEKLLRENLRSVKELCPGVTPSQLLALKGAKSRSVLIVGEGRHASCGERKMVRHSFRIIALAGRKSVAECISKSCRRCVEP